MICFDLCGYGCFCGLWLVLDYLVYLKCVVVVDMVEVVWWFG